jgi:hypothetical protein
MRKHHAVALLLLSAALAGCAYRPSVPEQWTARDAREAIRLSLHRISDERMAPARARGYAPTFTIDDIQVTDQGFTAHGLEAWERDQPYLGGVHQVDYASISDVRIVPYRRAMWVWTVLTAGLIGPHWGKRLQVTFRDDNRVLYPAAVQDSPDWWKNVFPLWPFFPRGPTGSNAHRLGAGIVYMAQQAKPQ